MSRPTLDVHTDHGQQAIEPDRAERSAPLSDVLRRHGLPLNTRCGQRMLCDGCVVELSGGQVVSIHGGGPIEPIAGIPRSIRACEHRMDGEHAAAIRIPHRSMLAYEPHVVADFRSNVPRADDPLVQCVRLSAAEARDESSLPASINEHAPHPLPTRVDFHDPPDYWENSPESDPRDRQATLEHRVDHWAITRLSTTAPTQRLGAAIDIGTTTVAVLLVELATGKVLAKAADFNQQMLLGDDVVTRITLCANDPAMRTRLQDAVARRTIAPLLTEVLTSAGADAHSLATIVVAANTTMLHLLAGVDPSPLGVAPFTAPFLDHRLLDAHAIIGPPVPAGIGMHLLPSAAAYIGADLTGGTLASGLAYDAGPSLLVDVGTNGEIILRHGDRLLGCATAAGPAFEGAGLSCGIRAGHGAIGHLRIDPITWAVQSDIIRTDAQSDDLRPAGLCGSAYIDFLGEGRRSGLLSAAGRFNRDAAGVNGDRFVAWRNGKESGFLIARGQGNRPLVVTEVDVAHLLPAKAAIAAGVLILLRRAGLQPSDIQRIYLAGGFGTHMSAPHAIACGLLPGFTAQQIQTVGNTSLAGAYLSLLDSTALREIARISRSIDIIELNLDPDFEDCYIDQMALPDPACPPPQPHNPPPGGGWFF